MTLYSEEISLFPCKQEEKSTQNSASGQVLLMQSEAPITVIPTPYFVVEIQFITSPVAQTSGT
jgi:hypothetical protein